jgi:outer membrane protein assembly factor BamB
MPIFLLKLKFFFLYFFLTVLVFFSSSSKTIADQSPNNLSWETSAGSYHSERFFTSSQITKNNIKDLEKFWVFNSGSTAKFNTVQSPPIFIGDQLILVTITGELISVSPENGKLLWKKKLEVPLGRRGLTYNKSIDKDINGIYVSSGKNIIQLDKNGDIISKILTGKSLLHPILNEKNLYVATLRGGIKAYDLKTRKEIWVNSLFKNNMQSRVWSGFSFDKESNLLFVVTSNPGDLLAENRTGDDFSVSLIAVNADSGKIEWQYKHIVNDVWDFDLISNPIIVKNLKISNQDLPVNCVIALTKTGDVIMVDIKNGLPVFKNSYDSIQVQKSDMKNVDLSPTQKLYLKPEKFSKIEIDMDKDFNHLKEDNLRYVKNKLRHAISGFYIPPSTNYDVITYGIHGGAEWPGATLYRDDKSTNLIIPSNNYPWIIRVNYQEKIYLDIVNNTLFRKLYFKIESIKDRLKNFITGARKKQKTAKGFLNLKQPMSEGVIYSNSIDTSFKNRTGVNEYFPEKLLIDKIANVIYRFTPGSSNNTLYKEKCSSCHGVARQGRHENETKGDNFYPSLVGITKTDKWSAIDTYKKVRIVHKENNINFDLNADQYLGMMDYFDKFDENLFEKNLIKKESFWQILLDKKGLPATKPPWGKITNINLLNGAKAWEVPFGRRKISDNEYIYGDTNFGGVLSTKSKIIFANGTTTPLAYAYDIDNGKKIWETSLPYAGSAPPMAFRYKGCDIIIFTATGGRYVGYTKNGDSTVAYKLKSCKFN